MLKANGKRLPHAVLFGCGITFYGRTMRKHERLILIGGESEMLNLRTSRK